MNDLWFRCQCSSSGGKGLSCQHPANKIQGIKNFLNLVTNLEFTQSPPWTIFWPEQDIGPTLETHKMPSTPSWLSPTLRTHTTHTTMPSEVETSM